jgi:hypothetical protein
MPTAAPTPCLRCHTLGPCEHRGEARRLRRSTRWTTEAKATVEAWVAKHGWLCPGWQRPAHRVGVGDLQCDHADALAVHGDTGRRAVLCLKCNASKGAR